MHAILMAGAICGAMDITAALTVYGSMGLKPMRLLQGISAALLGPQAYQGGIPTAALGLLLHFVIALGAAATYYAVSRKLRFLTDYAIPCGIAYAVIVYFFMQNIVLPLSRAAHRPFVLKFMIIGIVIHICCVGLPIALTIRRFARN
jgi:uncharacterized membrane protein YagU involved in acid resistance